MYASISTHWVLYGSYELLISTQYSGKFFFNMASQCQGARGHSGRVLD